MVKNYIITEKQLCTVATIQQLYEVCIKKSCSDDYTGNQIKAWISSSYKKYFWEHILLYQKVWFAYENQKLIGWITLKNEHHIDYLFVAPDYQRLSVASSLFHQVYTYVKQNKVIELTAEVSLTALNFFLSIGFTIRKEQSIQKGDVALKNFQMYLLL